MMRGYGGEPAACCCEHRVLMLVVMAATIALTVELYIKTPKGFFPQDDTGLIFTSTRASPDISFQAMVDMQLQALDVDPAPIRRSPSVGSSVGGSAWNASVNQGRMFVSLKPLAERDNLPTARVIDRLRPKFARIPASRCGCSRRRTCASAAAGAARNTSSRCGAPTSTSC